VGLLLDNFPRKDNAGLRVGVIGLGVGTLAAYGHAGDYYRLYEIDPAVIALSRGNSPMFTFVRDSQAKTDIVQGDARIIMQDEAERGERQNFDVLVVDAFSSDSIPVHLLTREAVDLYLKHLRGSKSVIAFHISCNSIDLRPLMIALSREYHFATLDVHGTDQNGIENAWVLVSADPQMLEMPALAKAGSPVEATRTIRMWTDNYSNLSELLVGWSF